MTIAKFPSRIPSANGGQASTSGTQIHGIRSRRIVNTVRTNRIPTQVHRSHARGSDVSTDRNGRTNGG